MVKTGAVKMGAVWDRTTHFIGANAAPVATIAIASILVPTVVGQGVQLAMTGGDPTAAVGSSGLLTLLTSLITLLGQLALIALAIDATVGVGGAFSIAVRRLLPVIGLSILLGLIFLLLVLPIFGVLFSAGLDIAALSAGDAGTMPGMSAATGLFIVVYGLALFPLSLWLWARFSVLLPTVIWERRGIGALAQAFRLTRGYGLKIAGVFVLFGIVFLVAILAVGGVFGAVIALTAGGAGEFGVGGLLVILATAIVTTIFPVIYSVFIAMLYKSLVDDREPAAVFE